MQKENHKKNKYFLQKICTYQKKVVSLQEI